MPHQKITFDQILNSAPIIFWAIDVDGILTMSLGKGLENLNVRPNQNVGQSIYDLYKNVPDVCNHARRALAGEQFTAEFEVLGRWFSTTYTPVYNGNNIVGVSAISNDVTNSKKLENLPQLIIETIPQGIWRTNPDGSADYFSPRFYEIVGYRPEEFLGWGWSEVIHPEDKEKSLIEWQRCRSLRLPVSVDFRIKTKDGRYRWFLSKGNPFFDESGELTKYYGTWTDITEEKISQKKMQSALELRDEFLSIASHELKTPLTSLKIQSQLQSRLIKNNRPDAYAKEKIDLYNERVEKLVSRLDRLVDDMLDISRIRTGRLTIHRENTNLASVVKDVVDRMQSEFLTETHKKIAADIPDQVPAYIDNFRIEQVIGNLLKNALKYGDKKGVSISLKITDGEALITVIDQGLGIHPKDHEKIFERFERAISPNEISGFGLGLFISREIIKAHDGRIWLESELGKGSKFFVALPVR